MQWLRNNLSLLKGGSQDEELFLLLNSGVLKRSASWRV
jgi:hypothetical protein